MVSHACSAGTPTSERRTQHPGPRWRPWRAAWVDAAYGRDGFWSTQRPGDHFSTAVGVGALVARAVAGMVPGGGQVVVDVGSGDGRLLAVLVDLLPDVALVGVDRRPRPAGLDPRIAWAEDHWDVDAGRWVAGGPDAWAGPGRAPLLVAHEWLDDLPVPVVERAAGRWHEVEVDVTGGERRGPVVGSEDRTWLTRWWDGDGDGQEGARRAEVGRSRDAAWATLVRAAVDRGGAALSVDYGHVAGSRPVGGTFLAYGGGRQRRPVPDGSVNLTAGVAVDALAAAGEEAGATTLLLGRQSEVLAPTPPDPGRPDPDDRDLDDDDLDDHRLHNHDLDDHGLEALVRRSQRAALTAPGRWGDAWWLLQGAGPGAGRDRRRAPRH